MDSGGVHVARPNMTLWIEKLELRYSHFSLKIERLCSIGILGFSITHCLLSKRAFLLEAVVRRRVVVRRYAKTHGV